MLAYEAEAFRNKIHSMSRDELIAKAMDMFFEMSTVSDRLRELEKIHTEMATQYQQCKDECNGLRIQVEELEKQNAHITGVKVLQTEELFGQSSEKLETLLNGSEAVSDPLLEDGVEMPEQPVEHKKEEIPAKRKHGKNHKKRMDISGLPEYVTYEYDIDELNREYGKGNWRFSFWNAHKSIEVVRQSTYVKTVYTPVISYGTEQAMARIPYTQPLFNRSMASASLVAAIMYDRYGLFTPLYRQEHDPYRFGFELSRQTMANWVVHAAEDYFTPVYGKLCDIVRDATYQQCDETTWRVICDGRKSGAKSYIWCHRTSELSTEEQAVVYCYDMSRSSDQCLRFYEGLDHPITITCDAYSVYQALEDIFTGKIKITGCMMHARRRFVESYVVSGGRKAPSEESERLPEYKAIEIIANLYQEENALRELPPEERHRKRQETIRSKVDEYFSYLRSFDMEDPSLSDKLKEAIQYSLNQEDYLRRFLEDGNIPVDNGATERSIRPITQERKSSLFSYTVRGAEASCVISSLVETAKIHKADGYLYLKYLLENMPEYTLTFGRDESYLDDMMPWSSAFRKYEKEQRSTLPFLHLPEGKDKPKTPRKKDEPQATVA